MIVNSAEGRAAAMNASLDRLRLPDMQPGAVWIVGAGPGDPGLLTALALSALQQADVVVHDALVGREILELIRPAARRVYVGKRAGSHTTPQEEINDILVAWARRGLRVLRLKGGDPFVFGRGGEEAAALKAAGLPFRIVPGVTAGIGGLAYAGIPATQRGINSVASIITGQGRDGGLPADIDWAALARSSPVIICYMAVKSLPDIATRLLAAGRAPETPVAVVASATLPGQRVLRSSLGGCSLDLGRSGLAAPAIIVIGEVARLADALAWFESGAEAVAEAEAGDAPVAAGLGE